MIEGLRAGETAPGGQAGVLCLGNVQDGGAGYSTWRDSAPRAVEAVPGGETQPIAMFQPSLDLDHLTACLNRLSTRERSVIIMTFYDEQRHDEVARALDLSSENVRVIWHRALGRLRNCMWRGVA